MEPASTLEHIQPEDMAFPNSKTCSSVTAIMFHDGGGTTYPYHCMGALYRNVYGIGNPHFFNGDIFPGGIKQMGKLYANYIRDAIADGTIKTRRKLNGQVDLLLGGWSLGGFLSMEVAHELARDEKINVAGIVMVDSCYDDDDDDFCPIDFSEDGKTRNEILSQRAMKEAVNMLDTWKAPRWDGDLAGKRPKMILIKCRDNVPTKTGQVSCIDSTRDDDTLGWSEYDPKLFTKVLEIPGHHFSIFDRGMVDSTTRAIQNAFDKLTSPNSRQRMLAELQCM